MVQLSKPVHQQNYTGQLFKPVTHVLFDIDGLLLRTEDIYEKVDGIMIAKYGGVYGQDIRLKVLGRTELDAATIIVNEYKLPLTPHEYKIQANKLQMTLLKDCTLMPGAESLIKHLASMKIPMALATSSSAESVAVKSSKYRSLFGLFDHLVAASSDPAVKHGKPKPDIFLFCAERFNDSPNPSQCLVFEDAPNGVEAAVSAGMQVVMVPDHSIPKDATQKATVVLKSLEDFKPELFSLPPFPLSKSTVIQGP